VRAHSLTCVPAKGHRSLGKQSTSFLQTMTCANDPNSLLQPQSISILLHLHLVLCMSHMSHMQEQDHE
jgi:hypothetical protein